MGESWEPLGEPAAAMEVWREAVVDLEGAGDVHGVARLHRRLAFAAQAGGDITGARDHLAAGIGALRALPPSDELVELYAARLLIDTPFTEPERAKEISAELTRLARVLGSPRATAEALLAEGSLWYLGGLRVEAPVPKAHEAARIAAEAGEWLLARRAHRELVWHATSTGNHPTMRHHCEAQIDIDERLGDTAHQSGPKMQLSYAELFAGHFDLALSLAEEGVVHARRYDQRRAQAMCLGAVALVKIHRGELDAAEECLVEARHVFPAVMKDPRGGMHLVGWPEAMLALERGDTASVIASPTGLLHWSLLRSLVGTAHVLAGDLGSALDNVALLLSGTTDSRNGQPPPSLYSAALADRLLGQVKHAQRETDTAREHLERSAVVLAALDLPFEAAVSQLYAGTVDSVREALAAFETLGAALYAERARRALRSLGVRLPSARSGRGSGDPLSRREMEVARLVAEGLTNAEIADKLVLSIRTVESHLDHIYGRLAISSRVALAAWVTESAQPADPIT